MTAARVDKLAEHMAAARSRNDVAPRCVEETSLAALLPAEGAKHPATRAALEDSIATPDDAHPDLPSLRGERASLQNADRKMAMARVRERRVERQTEEETQPQHPTQLLDDPCGSDPSECENWPPLRLPQPPPRKGAAVDIGLATCDFKTLSAAISQHLEASEAAAEVVSAELDSLGSSQWQPPMPPQSVSEAVRTVGNSASSNTAPPALIPRRPSVENTAGALRPSRPMQGGHGRSVIAALRQVKDDEAKRARRVAEVHAEGKRRVLLEEKAQNELAAASSCSTSSSSFPAAKNESTAVATKEPNSGHSSPAGPESQSPARLMLQRRLQLRREACNAEPPIPPEPPCESTSRQSPYGWDIEEKINSEATGGTPTQQLLSWQDLFFEDGVDDVDESLSSCGNLNSLERETSRKVSWSENASDEYAGEEVVKCIPACRHSSCSNGTNGEGQDCTMSMASTASTWRPARSASASPPPDAISLGSDMRSEGGPDDELPNGIFDVFASAARGTPPPANTHRASPRHQAFLSGLAETSVAQTESGKKASVEPEAFLSEFPKVQGRAKGAGVNSGRQELSEQEEAALVVLRKRQAARFAARGQVFAAEPSATTDEHNAREDEEEVLHLSQSHAEKSDVTSNGDVGLESDPSQDCHMVVHSDLCSSSLCLTAPLEERQVASDFLVQSPPKSNSSPFPSCEPTPNIDSANSCELARTLGDTDAFLEPVIPDGDTWIPRPSAASSSRADPCMSLDVRHAGEQHLQACSSPEETMPIHMQDGPPIDELDGNYGRPTTRRGSRGNVNSPPAGTGRLDDTGCPVRDNANDFDSPSSANSSVELLWQMPQACDSRDSNGEGGRSRVGLPFNDCDYSLPPCDSEFAFAVSDQGRIDMYGLDASGSDDELFCFGPPGELELWEQTLAPRNLYVILEEDSLRSSTASSYASPLHTPNSRSFGAGPLQATASQRWPPLCPEDGVWAHGPSEAATSCRRVDSEVIASKLAKLKADQDNATTASGMSSSVDKAADSQEAVLFDADMQGDADLSDPNLLSNYWPQPVSKASAQGQVVADRALCEDETSLPLATLSGYMTVACNPAMATMLSADMAQRSAMQSVDGIAVAEKEAPVSSDWTPSLALLEAAVTSPQHSTSTKGSCMGAGTLPQAVLMQEQCRDACMAASRETTLQAHGPYGPFYISASVPTATKDADWEAPRVYAIAIEEDPEWMAAVRIQGAYRGRAACQRLKSPVVHPVANPVDARQATVVSAAKSLAALRAQVQRETEQAAALRVQACWRGHSIRRSTWAAELRIRQERASKNPASSRTSQCNTHTGESARRQSGARSHRASRDFEQSAPASANAGIHKPARGKCPSIGVDESRQLAKQRVAKHVRGSLPNQRCYDQKVAMSSQPTSSVRRQTVSEMLQQESSNRDGSQPISSVRRQTVSEMLQQESSNRDGLPKLASARRASQRDGRVSLRDTRSLPPAELIGQRRVQKSRGSSAPRPRRSQEATAPFAGHQDGRERLPVALSPRAAATGAASAFASPRTNDGVARTRTPRRVAAAAGESAQVPCLPFGVPSSPGTGCSASPRRSWG